VQLILDTETYSATDLNKSGVYRYVEDPDFQVLMCAWSLDGGPVRVTIGQQQILDELGGMLTDPAVTKVAHNAQFDRVVLSAALGMPVGQYLDPRQWDDTMARAAEVGLPQSLKDLALVLGGEQKDTAGTALINFFTKPNRQGNRNLPQDHPDKWQQFVDYCAQDVRTLADVLDRLPPWPTETEREVYWTDQVINDRGIAADLESARIAVDQDELGRGEAGLRLQELLGIDNANSVPQVHEGLQRLGLTLPDLRAETISAALERQDLTPQQREALELRSDLALAASKKYLAIIETACSDGRARGAFRFFGAHTGRWSGRGIQLQNLPRQQTKHPEAHIVDLHLGNMVGPQVLKALVRAMFVGPFVVSDYSAIEARVLAWVAGEQWALDAFELGRDIYEETAQRMGGMSRQQGKVAVLALGYQGGINSLFHMGARGDDAELERMKNQWRRANPNIVQLWSQIEEAFGHGGRAGVLRVEVDGDDRKIILPSGRPMVYRNVRWERWNVRDEATGRTVSKQGWRFDGKFGRTDTYGGRLTENAVQAIARDLLADALVNLEREGLPVVGHVHDEVIVQAGPDELEKVNNILSSAPAWAEGLPLAAEGFVCDRYMKG